MITVLPNAFKNVFQHQYGAKLENMEYSISPPLRPSYSLQMFLRQDLLLPEVQRPLQVTPTLPNEVLYLLLKNVHIHNR